jgi:hypothetical protein
MGKGLIQEGECINVADNNNVLLWFGVAIHYRFPQFLHKQQTWLWAP